METFEERLEAYKVLEEYRADWVRYASEILNVRLDDDQIEILQAIRNNRRVSIRSGHARGKDYVTAVACVCFLTLYYPSKVVVTAPTGRQVDGIMLAEIKKIYKNAKGNLGGRVMSRGIKMSEDDTWYLIGFKTADDSGEAWTGFHSPNIMVAVTEATGLEDSTFNALEGLLQGNSHLILAFNPIKATGEAFQSTTSHLYKSFRLNCLHSPNVINWQRVLDGEITEQEYWKLHIPGQVDWTWIDEKIQKPGWVRKIDEPSEPYDFEWNGMYYRPDDLFRVKVLGEFPEEGEDTLIPMSLLNEAFKRYENLTEDQLKENRETEPLRVGVDIAGMGRDFNVLCERAGMIVENIYPFQKNSTSETIHMEVAGKIISIKKRNNYRDPKFFIDTIGEGAGTYSRLKELGYTCVYSAKSTYKANHLSDKTGNLEFTNMRAYVFWRIREWLQDGGAIPYNEYLEEELPRIKYEFTSNGKIQIEKKDELKKKLGRSPDFSDSLAQTFFRTKKRNIKSDGSALNNLI